MNKFKCMNSTCTNSYYDCEEIYKTEIFCNIDRRDDIDTVNIFSYLAIFSKVCIEKYVYNILENIKK